MALRQGEAGTAVEEICRKGIVADPTLDRTTFQEVLRKNGKARAAPSGRGVGRVFVPGARMPRMPALGRQSVDDPISEPQAKPGAAAQADAGDGRSSCPCWLPSVTRLPQA
jgi:hypothetical protein